MGCNQKLRMCWVAPHLSDMVYSDGFNVQTKNLEAKVRDTRHQKNALVPLQYGDAVSTARKAVRK